METWNSIVRLVRLGDRVVHYQWWEFDMKQLGQGVRLVIERLGSKQLLVVAECSLHQASAVGGFP